MTRSLRDRKSQGEQQEGREDNGLRLSYVRMKSFKYFLSIVANSETFTVRERFNRLSDPHAGLNTADRAPVVPPAPVLNIQTETEVNYAWFAFALRRPPRAPPDTSATDPIGFVCALQFVLMREKLSFWLRCSLQDRTRFNLCSRLSGSLREDKDKPLTL